jgi:hypothetical protein
MTGSAIAAIAATSTPIITALFIFIVIPLQVLGKRKKVCARRGYRTEFN